MQLFSLRYVVPLVSAGLMLAACGGAQEEGQEPSASVTSSAPTAQAPSEGGTVTALAAPTVSVSCGRTSSNDITCTASASGGVPPYTYHWTERQFMYANNRWYTVGGTSGPSPTESFDCVEIIPPSPGVYSLQLWVSVTDSLGANSGNVFSTPTPCD